MSEDFVKIIVKDGTDRRLDNFVGKLSDATTMTKIMKILSSKYGMKVHWKELAKHETDFLSLDNDFLKW